MKKTTVITLAMIITMALSTTYAQKSFDPSQYSYEVYRSLPSPYTNQCPILKGIRTTSDTSWLYMKALREAQKAQDIVRMNTMSAINTSDTIRTLETIKWLDKYTKHQTCLAINSDSCVYNCISVQICYHYTIAVLNDYIKDIERNCADNNNKRLKDIRSLKSELEAGLSNVKGVIEYLEEKNKEIRSRRVQEVQEAMSDTIRLLLK